MERKEMKSREEQFTNKLKEELSNNLNLSKYEVTSGECLVYKFLIDANGKLQPAKYKVPKRGQLAFQTDLMIKKINAKNKKNGIPLLVIEIKYGRFTTHDVITYSAKALKHKEIYPYLRYGLVVGEVEQIYKRFFTHNAGFDFAIAVKEKNLHEITEIVKTQLETAENLLSVLRDKQVKQYVTNIKLTYSNS
jgi:hypothetical protein